MKHREFYQIGLSTLGVKKGREFYEGVLGFKATVVETVKIKEGGRLPHIFFDIGRDQLVGLVEPRGVPELLREYDVGIKRRPGAPAAFHHFALDAGSEAGPIDRRDQLRASGVEVTHIVDHGWSKAICFKDLNGLSLEYGRALRNPTKNDATMQERFSTRRAALDLSNVASAEVPEVQSHAHRQSQAQGEFPWFASLPHSLEGP